MAGWRWGLLTVGLLSACVPQPAKPVPPGAGPDWQAAGFTAAEGEAYAQLGMAPLAARTLKASGMMPSDLQAWEAILPGASGPYGGDPPVDTFLSLKQAGLSPADVQPLAAAGLPFKHANVVLNAVALQRAGYSPSQAVDYAERGVTPGGVAAYRRQRAQAAADQRAAAAKRAQMDAALAEKCPGGIQSGGMMFQMSPFAIEGKCYALSPLPVGQWESATEGLILVMGTPVDIETDTPMAGQMTPPGLYVGEAPLQYEAVSGAASTAYKLHYIGPDPR